MNTGTYLLENIEDFYATGKHIGKEILKSYGKTSLVLVATTVLDKDKVQEFLNGLSTKIDSDYIIGYSTGGFYYNSKLYTENSIMVFAFENIYRFVPVFEKIETPEDGYKIANDVIEKIKLKYGCISMKNKFLGLAFFDFSVWRMIDKIIKNIRKDLPIPIIGNIASDNKTYKDTFLIYNGDIVKDGCVFTLIMGKLKYKLIYFNPYKPTELYAKITKSEGNIIYELNNKPAYQEYLRLISKHTGLSIIDIEQYFNKHLNTLDFRITYPLAYSDVYGNLINLYIYRVKNDALYVNSEIPEGTFLTLMETNPNYIMECCEAFRKIRSKFKNSLAIINQCYALEIIKNPDFRTEKSHPFLEMLFNQRIVPCDEKYLFINLSYGECVAKGLSTIFSPLSYSGVVLELDALKNIKDYLIEGFEFNKEEAEIIPFLIDNIATIEEISNKLHIPLEKVKTYLDKFVSLNIVQKLDDKYYVDTSILEKSLMELHKKLKMDEDRKRNLRLKLINILS